MILKVATFVFKVLLKMHKMSVKEEIRNGPCTTDLLRILECPVCTEPPTPPIYNCQTGHSVCSICKDLLDKCPLCDQKFAESRNYTLESIVEKSVFQCKYAEQGCTDLIEGSCLEKHRKVCRFR